MKRFLVRGTASLVGAITIAVCAAGASTAAAATVSGTLEGWQSPTLGSRDYVITGHAYGGARLTTAALSLSGTPVTSSAIKCDDASCANGSVTLTLATTDYADGLYKLDITISADGAAPFTIEKDLEIWNHRPTGSNTATLDVGSSGNGQAPGAQNPGGAAGGGAVEGATATSCKSPRLSMFLDQKPLRVSKGVPVLLKNKRYRFTGRLTCLVGNKRTSAAKGSKIALRNVVGRRTHTVKGTTVKSGGKITITLKYASSRTLEFRYTNGEGKTSKVRIKVRIAQRKG